MTIFVMFFVELMAARFDVFGSHDHHDDLESADPALDIAADHAKENDTAKLQDGKHSSYESMCTTA
jgi:zinc transporter 1/2/3